MKKISSLILALCMVFALAACSAIELPPLPDVEAIKAEEAAQAEAEAAAQAAEVQAMMESEALPTEAVQLANHVIVNISSFNETYMDPQHEAEPILEVSWELPAVYVEGRDEAGAIINEHIAAINETFHTGNDYGYGTASGVSLLLEAATDNYAYIVNTGAENTPMLYSTGLSVKVPRADEKALSLRYTTYEYTGGAHGMYVDRAYIFDTATGERVTLDMLSADADAFSAFLQEYMLSLYEADEDGYYSERALLDSETAPGALAALIREGSWYLGDEGLVIFSDIYELGPYAAGICEFTVPYSALEGRLDERYMPVDKSGDGSFSLIDQSELTDGSAQIIDRVTVDAEGEQLCLAAEGIVYDVILSEVSYLDKFYETAQLWRCSYMNDCLLQLDVSVPEGMPNLMLSYSDAAGERHSLYITQSGVDGSIVLDGDDIEAVG